MLHPNKGNLLFAIKGNDLLVTIYCTPLCIRIGKKRLPVVRFRHSKFTDDGSPQLLYNTVLREIMRRVNLIGISQSMVLTTSLDLVRPVAILTSWFYFFLHPLFPPLPSSSPKTTGLRQLMSKDIAKGLSFVNQYMSQFEIGQFFQTEEEFSHYFLCPSMPGYVHTYVAEDPITGAITDMFGFKLTDTITDRFGFKLTDADKTREAIVTTIIPTRSPAKQLIVDLLLCAKQKGAEVVSTIQYGLKRDNFETLFFNCNFVYLHIYNYRYPEVDEDNCCVPVF